MAYLHDMSADRVKLRHEFGGIFGIQEILLAVCFLGMTAKVIAQNVNQINKSMTLRFDLG